MTSPSILSMTVSAPSLQRLAEGAGDLLAGIEGDPATEVTGLAYDSRAVEVGDLFFCVRGARVDGHEFAAEAVRAGAVALCVERPTGAGVPEVRVADVRRAMGGMAASYYARPSDGMLMLGVTGTNGKTTTVFLLDSILRAAGHTTGLIGTIETRVGGDRRAGVRTTPESVDLQRLFAEMRLEDVNAVAMEVTSHGLVLHRVEGVRFRVAAFTNLSQDHLDFHRGMEDYFEAKRSLFRPERTDRGVVNVDDPYGRKLFEDAVIPCTAFGMSNEAHVRAHDVHLGADGCAFAVDTPVGELRIRTSLVGGFNVYNCLAAIACSIEVGIGVDAIGAGIRDLRAVPGRFESISSGQPFAVVVDYAHTPDSLDNALRAARDLARAGGNGGRVVCVFGCGGDRDKGKRPLMGAVAARLSDHAVVTSDNPRSERPMAIIEQILEGVVAEAPVGAEGAGTAVEEDRRAAIRHALGWARPGDVVVIAGKGHETGQQFADRTIPFDDRDVAREELAALGWGPAP